MTVLDGKVIAKAIKSDVAVEAETLRQNGVVPTLAIVVATSDESTAWYVNSIVKAAQSCGIEATPHTLPDAATTVEMVSALTQLANDSSVHGIILQTPLPETVLPDDLLKLIPVEKDVDGANPLSAGNLIYGTKAFAPATAAAAMKILEHYGIPLSGKQVVVVGRSRIVGKPVAHLLLEQDATVTICHRYTTDLSYHTKQADILVVAVGKAGIITADMVKPGAVIIDVGTNVTENGELVGDVEPAAGDIADAMTPVPGGVGPVTTALILQHTIEAAKSL